jgi:hypothetical protein
MVAPDDAWMCQQNIRRYRRLLEETEDQARRTKLEDLLAEEQAKLRRPPNVRPI